MKSNLTFKQKMNKYGGLLPFYIPAAVFAIIFLYLPMVGFVMAFKENPNLIGSSSALAGIFEAPWNGIDNFKIIFSRPEFSSALANTLIISMLKIIIVFPIPILVAIVLTEVNGKIIKKTMQIVMYLPYFLSWVIIGGIFTAILDKNVGVVNNILESLGFGRYPFVTSNDTFRGVVVLSTMWKDIGWSAITYIAAITAVDPSQTEAAKIDGASKLQQIFHITLPGISSTIAVLFILRIGYIMDAGFEQIFVMYTPLVQDSGDILGTYCYRLVRGQMIPEYATSSAIGLFNSGIAFILIIVGDKVSKKLFGKGVW